jgi:enoyl-CoA hydratase
MQLEKRGPDPAVRYECSNGVAVITLNRPDARNAINPEMACRLSDAFERFALDETLRVAILTGSGNKAFCSGGDLALTLPLLTGARQARDAWDERLLRDSDVMDCSSLRRPPTNKPIIAAINGACLAGGMETMLGTDIRIAVDHAVFGLPEATRALIPFAGSLVRLPRQVPYCVAMELMLVGGTMSASQAMGVGLINQVCSSEELMTLAWDYALKIAANGPVAVQQIKRTVLASSGTTLEAGYLIEDESKGIVMASSDAREGPLAFMQKRTPVYKGA